MATSKPPNMPFDLSALKQAIAQADRPTLSGLLLRNVEQLDINNQFELFAELYEQQVVSQWSDEKLLKAVGDFHQKSVQGAFYDHQWGYDGRYDAITPLTQSWYDEAGFWLDVLCTERPERSKSCRLQGLQLMLALIDRLDEETIVVPHDTWGEENIYTRGDYRAYYQQL